MFPGFMWWKKTQWFWGIFKQRISVTQFVRTRPQSWTESGGLASVKSSECGAESCCRSEASGRLSGCAWKTAMWNNPLRERKKKQQKNAAAVFPFHFNLLTRRNLRCYVRAWEWSAWLWQWRSTVEAICVALCVKYSSKLPACVSGGVLICVLDAFNQLFSNLISADTCFESIVSDFLNCGIGLTKLEHHVLTK